MHVKEKGIEPNSNKSECWFVFDFLLISFHFVMLTSKLTLAYFHFATMQVVGDLSQPSMYSNSRLISLDDASATY